jgi:predicted nucleotidyltransferase
MRLTPAQTDVILRTVDAVTGGLAQVYLFGSRLDDSARGGDVDLLLEADAPLGVLRRARIKMVLEEQLRLPVDVIEHVRGVDPSAFQALARAKAVRLGRAP